MKDLYNYTASEVRQALAAAPKVINLRRPADLARLTADLIINHPTKIEQIKYMTSVLNGVYDRIPDNRKPALPGKMMNISGVDDKLCKTNEAGQTWCVTADTDVVTPKVIPTQTAAAPGQSTGWKIINKAGKLFFQIGPVVIAALVFAAWLTFGWAAAIAALVFSLLVFPETTIKMIRKIAEGIRYAIEETAKTIKAGAKALGIGDFFLYGALLLGSFLIISKQ